MEGAYNIIFSLFDKGSFETAGPTGLGRQTILFGRLLSSAQTGRVYDYASLMLAALCLALIGVYLFPAGDPTCFGSKKDCSSFEGYNFFLNWLEKSYHQFAVLTDLSSLSFTTLDITILLLSPIVLKRLKKVCLVEVSSKLQLPCQPSAVVTNTPSLPASSLPVLRIVSVEWSKRVHPGEVAPKLQLRTVDAPRLSATSRPLRR
jgi:hypothetical protein